MFFFKEQHYKKKKKKTSRAAGCMPAAHPAGISFIPDVINVSQDSGEELVS